MPNVLLCAESDRRLGSSEVSAAVSPPSIRRSASAARKVVRAVSPRAVRDFAACVKRGCDSKARGRRAAVPCGISRSTCLRDPISAVVCVLRRGTAVTSTGLRPSRLPSLAAAEPRPVAAVPAACLFPSRPEPNPAGLQRAESEARDSENCLELHRVAAPSAWERSPGAPELRSFSSWRLRERTPLLHPRLRYLRERAKAAAQCPRLGPAHPNHPSLTKQWRGLG
jgi:hypothetical protein